MRSEQPVQSSRRRFCRIAGAPVAALLLLAAPTVFAQGAAPSWTDAEVRKVDRDAAKLTLKHAEIKNLDMPAMTMVFKVQDKAMLAGLEPGTRVRIKAVQQAGQYVVMELQRAP